MDFINDRSGRHLLRINNLMQMPDFVKQASVDADENAKLPDHLFADDSKREFPIDTAGHAFLSFAYAKSANVTNKRINKAIASALEHFPEAKVAAEQLSAALLKECQEVAPQRQFAIYVDFGPAKSASTKPMEQAGGVHGFYPINDDQEIVSSAIKLGNEKHRLPLGLFVEGCTAILKAAAEHKCLKQLPTKIVDYGTERLPDMEFVKQQATKRQQMTNDSVYLEIAAAMDGDTDRANGDWAELWMDADAQNGIKAARHTLDAFQILNSGPTKLALEQELNSWTLVKGAAIPVAALQALNATTIDANFPKEASDKINAIIKQASTVTGPDLVPQFAALDDAIQRKLLLLVARD